MTVDRKTSFYRNVGWTLIAGGFVLLAITAFMNWFQGDHIGVTTAGKLLNSIGSVAIDLVGIVVIGVACGACWAAKRWVWASIFTVAVILSAGWSVNSIMSFQATERISASSARLKAIQRSAAADKLQIDDYKWKRGTAVRAGDRIERKDFLGSAQGSIKEFREAKVQAQIEPDAGAQAWSKWLGYSLENVQLTQAGYFALLIIFLKSICFPGGGYFLDPMSWLNQPSEPGSNQKNSDGSPGSGGGSGGSGGGEPRKKPDLKPVPKGEPTPLRAEPSKQRRTWSYVPATGAPERLERLSAFDRAWAVADQNPFLSTRQIADRAKVSQSTGARVQKRLRGKADRIIRKMGNGRGFHSPAYNH